jgi:hypothetical protein
VSDEESGAKNILEIITYPIYMLNQFIKKIKRKKMSGEGEACEESLGIMCCKACMKKFILATTNHAHGYAVIHAGKSNQSNPFLGYQLRHV